MQPICSYLRYKYLKTDHWYTFSRSLEVFFVLNKAQYFPRTATGPVVFMNHYSNRSKRCTEWTCQQCGSLMSVWSHNGEKEATFSCVVTRISSLLRSVNDLSTINMHVLTFWPSLIKPFLRKAPTQSDPASSSWTYPRWTPAQARLDPDCCLRNTEKESGSSLLVPFDHQWSKQVTMVAVT